MSKCLLLAVEKWDSSVIQRIKQIQYMVSALTQISFSTDLYLQCVENVCMCVCVLRLHWQIIKVAGPNDVLPH